MTVTAPQLTEQGAEWFKSSYSSGGEQCIEVAANLPGVVPIRDSKRPDGPALVFPRAAFAAFVNATTVGEFDDA